MKYIYDEQPLLTAAGAEYQYEPHIARLFTEKSRFDEEVINFKSKGKGVHRRIVVPREAVPVGENDKRTDGIDVEFSSSFIPRNETQQTFVDGIVGFLAQGKSGLAEAPTGFGKTVCTMDVIAYMGKQTAVVVTKEDVKDQWIAAAKMVLNLKDSEIGIVQGNHCQVHGKKLVICMIQSVSKAGKYPEGMFNSFGLVIWDEVHRVGADQFKESVWQFPAKLRLGLSATPYRKDGKEMVLHQHIGPVRAQVNKMSLVPKVFLKKTNFKIPRNQQTGQQIPHKPGKTMHINKIMGRDMERNMMIARFIRKAYEANRNIIVFSDMIEHLENIQAACRKFKVPMKDTGFYIGGLKKEEREAAKIKQVIFSTYAFCSEATDIPWLDTAVLATPRSDVIQIVGRVLREYPEKKEPVVFDLVDMDSAVFKGYSLKRKQWYKKIGAKVKPA